MLLPHMALKTPNFPAPGRNGELEMMPAGSGDNEDASTRVVRRNCWSV
jgi:hypothetical protein